MTQLLIVNIFLNRLLGYLAFVMNEESPKSYYSHHETIMNAIITAYLGAQRLLVGMLGNRSVSNRNSIMLKIDIYQELKQHQRILNVLCQVNDNIIDPALFDKLCIINANYQDIIRMIDIENRMYVKRSGLLSPRNNRK